MANDPAARNAAAVHQTARTLALISFADIGVFFARAAGGLCVRVEAGRPGLGAGRDAAGQARRCIAPPPARPLEPSQSILSA